MPARKSSVVEWLATPAQRRKGRHHVEYNALVLLSGELMTFVEEPEALEYRQGLPGATETLAAT